VAVILRLWHSASGRIAVLRSVAKRTKHRGKPVRQDRTRPSYRPAARGVTATLPDTAVVRITGIDQDGDAVARPVTWESADGQAPMILMQPEKPGTPALAPGERVLARLKPMGPGRYEARTLRRISESPGRILGVFKRGRTENRIIPTDRRSKAEWIVPPNQDRGAEADEIVLAEPLAQHLHLGLRPARILERLGRLGDARSISLIAIHTHDIPQSFPATALEEAKLAGDVRLGSRTDLRDLKLITIDGADARDFDDAVFAEPDPDHAGGFRLVVAIADVAHYVRPGSALDDAAGIRGNSVYFPDRVVPMLPEALSNGWCSLRPNEDRGCLFVELRIDRAGRKTSHRFGRGLMRSAARLTYEEVQTAHDSNNDLGVALPYLYAAFQALLTARLQRGALDLELPERKVVVDEQGQVTSVEPRPHLDSHRLIEEFMVLANVAAAEELERLHQPCMYRVHAPPSEEKLEALRGFLSTLGISLPPGNHLHPRDFDRVLRHFADTPESQLISEVMLRSQSQAAYSPDNIGHFGLALPRYAHFTSPIRRYADLLVHRALVRGLRLGPDGITDDQAAMFEEIAERITATERRAQQAERDAVDRYLTAFMTARIGGRFAACISGVTRFGLFVTVTETGASGIVPFASLPGDYWQYDEREQTLTGRRSQRVYRLAQPVEVLLSEANAVTGGMVFHILDGPLPKGALPKGALPGGGRPDGPVSRSGAAADRDAGPKPGKRPRRR
jgi:ribonuclease R